MADVYTKPSLTDRHALVSDRVRSANDDVVREADRIHQAIANNRKIRFRYFHYTPNRTNPKKYSKKGDFYTVSPYAMLWDNGNYYLYAYMDDGKFHTFRIDRMERISNPLQEERDGQKEFKEEALTAQEYKVFQMFRGEKAKVRVRFINRLADAVIDQLREEGMWIQVNASFFLHWQTARKAMARLKKREIHFIATDSHNLLKRPPNLGSVLEKVEKKLGAQTMAYLETTSAMVTCDMR